MKAYKLTDKNNQSYNNMQWGPNVTHTATGTSNELCSDGWIHFYRDPIIAVMMNPVHAQFSQPHLWECITKGEHLHEPLKSGCRTLTTVKRIDLPKVVYIQRTAFAILCAKEIYKNRKWNKWATKWLSGEDRSIETAEAGSYTFRSRAIGLVISYVNDSVRCVLDCDPSLSLTKYYTACTVYRVSRAKPKIDFIALTNKALTYT